MSANNGTNQAPGNAANPPLNPALRPQRLFHKVQLAMKQVDKKLETATIIGTWLSDDEMKDFRRTIRKIIRQEYDSTFDSWPRRTQHNYIPDARRAIVAAIAERRHDLFSVLNADDGEDWDDFVEADILLPSFYTE